MIEVGRSWTESKTEVTNRSLAPQWYELNGFYKLIGSDEVLLFTCDLDISDNGPGSDTEDFENNYKNDWNTRLEYRNESGIKRFHSSPRPEGLTTYFTGVGDDTSDPDEANWVVGGGTEAYIEMTSADTDKSVILTFTEDVWIKDGIIFYDSVPFGATIDVYINHPQAGTQAYFLRQLRLKGTSNIGIYLNSEDGGKIPKGLELILKVTNGSTPGNFDVWASIEMYRATTV